MSEFQDHITYCLNREGKSPIAKAIESGNIFGANIMLKILIKDKNFSYHSHLVYEDLPKLIKYDA